MGPGGRHSWGGTGEPNEGATCRRRGHQGASAPGMASRVPPTGPGPRLGTGHLWVQRTQVGLGGYNGGTEVPGIPRPSALTPAGTPTLSGSLGSRHGVPGTGHGPSTRSEGHLGSHAEVEGPALASLQQAVWVTRCLETGSRGPGTIPLPTSPPLVPARPWERRPPHPAAWPPALCSPRLVWPLPGGWPPWQGLEKVPKPGHLPGGSGWGLSMGGGSVHTDDGQGCGRGQGSVHMDGQV